MGKTVGILGGMGPKATVDLFNKIVDFTDAESDQEHIHIIIDNNVNIPDRTRFILGDGENPITELIETAVKLENNGADFIIMPCNTAHYFYDKLVNAVKTPFINMIEEVGKYIVRNYGKGKVGLLATIGTYNGRVYEKYCEKYGLEIVMPTDEIKEKLLDLIYRVKSGERDFNIDYINEILQKFKKEDVEIIILGCTELPLVFDSLKEQLKDFNFISSTDILARKAVEIAK
ncbi:aspartate racemase [Clostridium tetanomorphum]|uniref:Amino acid racemase n=1 Tax=Clostridium tetanomorphum TaxID=1553 RepID=A0A923IZT7_CLOTT|nr:amino acid racemase [Clostridium tetanomorphum]KAJ51764.1 aspartate racemase [Clostridium tetanomorphum DSM 665]MBC2397646.1 amino acid racemase [Clostridium tetanomorphum]MBP1864999.1 aspartate racemase [Clostridium tetanomorphum]NRS83404.1 aspartate racemase [Clostridium tetanomorphum]NRZ96603.1 aspartate racemase [Clostridium tetanomorphum]